MFTARSLLNIPSTTPREWTGEADALWIKPDRKLSVHDVMELMRDHFEGPSSTSPGGRAGPYALPYAGVP